MNASTRWLAVAVAACVVAACGGSTAATPAPSPIAKVGPTVITQAAFNIRLQSTLVAIAQGGGPSNNATMEAEVRASVLRSLILDAIIAQEASAQGVAATAAQVQTEIDTDAAQAGGLSQLESELGGAGGSIAQLQDEIRSQLNEQRLEDRFAQARAAMVEGILAGGANFAQTAKQYSDDTGTNTKGGDLGALSADNLKADDPSFSTAVQSLAVGAYTKTPVRDSGGYDIIEMYAKTTTTWSVRHILIAAPLPYTVQNRPAWFSEALFAAVAQDCQAGAIHVYITDAGADPCAGAPNLSPLPSPTPTAGR
jgi:parvulin-like peptidyl-prolyl isomerase